MSSRGETSLTNSIVTSIAQAPVAAGTSDQNGNIEDMSGYDGIRFIYAMGTITGSAVTSLKVQQGAVSNMSDAADLLGTDVTIADTDDDSLIIVEVWKPRERYVRPVLLRGTANAVIDFGIAEKYGAYKFPVTQDADVAASEIHNSPAEGTA